MSSKKSFSSETAVRYARALFELALEDKERDSIEGYALSLIAVYDKNKEFENFIKNPTQTFTDQLEVIKKISELLSFSKNFKNFLSLLVIKRRIFFLKKILNCYLKLSSIKRGEINARLISSKILSDQELKNISNELSKVIGSDISFEYKVDENLIGGFKMQIGSLMIDTSVRNKLKKYEQIMLEN